ncbi:MAG: 23S rRNA (adenine(2503)-C(2))-methyltransferase RlmN [Deltaproteobacteria bacterium]|nr:23S rRNA (adenine(2503)-C(2))-methyltransferase RlmN [Deltaproteobacteria bacterium]
MRMKVDLKGMSLAETEAWVEEAGLPLYRARQLRRWLLKSWVRSFDEMTDIPKLLRSELAEKAHINHLERVKVQVSKDGTRKYLFELQDGYLIEAVLIPERGHFTLCISSQAGCAMRCRFCLTGKQGLKRNLTAAEIVDQAVQVKRDMTDPERLTNIVFMGMGEPLANYEEVVKAVANLTAEDGMNFSHRTVTLSTCGLVPQIRKLGRDMTLNLAVSLNASNDETRTYLMPVNLSYPLSELMSALREFPLPNRRMITIEYILIEGVNDKDEDALNLVYLLEGLRSKINLIPLNPHSGLKMETPSMERIRHFQEILTRHYLTAVVRKSKGRDISAACGQLSGESTGGEVVPPYEKDGKAATMHPVDSF